MSTEKGFTLVEMAVTVAIASILIAIAVPNISSWIYNASISAAGESLQNGLRRAMAEAIKRNAPADFLLTNSLVTKTSAATVAANANGKNWLVRNSGDSSWVDGQNQAEAYPGVTVSGPAGIRFNSFGKITDLSDAALADNQIFRLTRTGTSRVICVYVTPSGGIRACDPSRAEGTPEACLPQVSTTECAP